MILRAIVVLVALGAVGAATHANVMHAGGYDGENAPLVIAIAALLAFGIGYATIAWREGKRLGSAIFMLCLLCGEAYWIGINAEREIASREASSAPIVMATTKRAATEKRLEAAEKAKSAADAAMITEAAKDGCRKNCAALLQTAKADAESELIEARRAVEALPPARSASGLPDRLGVAAWAWDLVMAGLRSVAVIGASMALALALHPRSVAADRESDSRTPDPTPKQTPARARAKPEKARPQILIAAPVHEREHISQFLRATLRPDPQGCASLRELHGRYLNWCGSQDLAPLPASELGRQLRTVVDAIGLECEPVEQGRDVVVRGAAIAA